MAIALDDLTGPDGPVALTRRTKLRSVDDTGIVRPPTYARPKGSRESTPWYAINQFPDGTATVELDSVQSQANRIEPIFIKGEFTDDRISELVPQVEIEYQDGGEPRTVSLMEASHRVADAILRTTEDAESVKAMLKILKDERRGEDLAKFAPTSFVFGAWDSRGGGAKISRALHSEIRAFDVSEPLGAPAQFTPTIPYKQLEIIKSEASERGYTPVPAPGGLGGVHVGGEIVQTRTIHLATLRPPHLVADASLRNYLLGLALVAATCAPVGGFLRAGCDLVPISENDDWTVLYADGRTEPFDISADDVIASAQAAAKTFGVGANKKLKVDPGQAQKDAAQKSEGNPG